MYSEKNRGIVNQDPRLYMLMIDLVHMVSLHTLKWLDIGEFQVCSYDFI